MKKVYIVVVTGKEPAILGVYSNKKEAEHNAYLYSLAYPVWTNVIEREVL